MNVNVKLAETDPFKNCVDFMFTVSSKIDMVYTDTQLYFYQLIDCHLSDR